MIPALAGDAELFSNVTRWMELLGWRGATPQTSREKGCTARTHTVQTRLLTNWPSFCSQ